MKTDKEPRISELKQLRSRFISIEIDVDAEGRPCILLSGDYMELAGFRPGDVIDGIVQQGLISLLRLE